MSFGMPAPRLEGVDALEEDLAATEASWALYKEYSSELKVRSCIGAPYVASCGQPRGLVLNGPQEILPR